MPTVIDITPPAGSLVRFISDLHLAHKRGNAPADLWALMEGVDMLVLCGDTAETRATCAEREHSMHLREQLRADAAARGVTLIELAGNHDPDIEPMLARFWGGKVVAMHGHCILPQVSPWSREYLSAKSRVRDIISTYPPVAEGESPLEHCLELTRRIARELSQHVPPKKKGKSRGGLLHELYHCFWPPTRPLSIVTSWLTCGWRAERWARRYVPEAELLIFGHFHRTGRWQYGRRTILNTGAWFQHATPYAVDVQDGQLLRYFCILPHGGGS